MPTLICSKCRTSYRVEALEAGKNVTCPKCQAVWQVQATTRKPSSPGAPAPADAAPTEEMPAAKPGAPKGPSVSGAGGPEDTVFVDEQVKPDSKAQGRPKNRAVAYQLPKSLGPYEILQQIGHGGMGVILQAHDEALKREVAIKILHPENREDPAKRLRFIKEAQITGQLEHPGIAPVHYLGWDESGNEFFSMKLVSGTTLDRILEGWHANDEAIRHEFPLARLLSIFERVCETVGFAHSHGVIHRDLKPSNVMIGFHGEVWVLDWGLAKVIGVEDAEDRPLASDERPAPNPLRSDLADVRTVDGIVVGTPEYMAPEQASGEKLDEKVDIFALGGVLYEMLTSKPPHAGKTVNEVVSRAAQGIFTPVRRTPLGKNAPTLLAAIAEKCLAQLREDRYASVSELIHDLRAYAAGEAIKALPDTAFDRLRRFTRRHRRAVAATCTLVGLLLLTITIAAVSIAKKEVLLAQKDHDTQIEREQRLQAELETQKALTASAEQARKRLRAFEPYAQAMDLLMRGQQPLSAASLLTKALDVDPEFPEAQYLLAEAQRLSGLPRQAAESYLKADALNLKIVGKPNLQAIIAAGFAYDGAGDYSKADEAFLRAKDLGANDPLALVGHMFLLVHQRRVREAQQHAEVALRSGKHLWETHFAMGCVLGEAVADGILPPAKRQEAIAELREALKLSPRQAEVFIWLSRVLRLGEPTEAERREATELLDQAIEQEHLNGSRYFARAIASIGAGNLAAAERDIAEAKKLSINSALLRFYEARIALLQRNREEAFRLYGEVLKDGRERPAFVYYWAKLGFELHRFDEVLPVFDRWCRANPQFPLVYALRAETKLAEADAKAAISEARLGLDIAPFNGPLRTLLARATLMDRKYEQALEASEKALELAPKDRDARMTRYEALVNLKRFREALEFLTSLEKDYPDDSERFKNEKERLERLIATEQK